MRFIFPFLLFLGGLLGSRSAVANESSGPLPPLPSHWDSTSWERNSSKTFWKATPKGTWRSSIAGNRSSGPSPQAGPQPSGNSDEEEALPHSPRLLDKQNEK